MSVLPTSNSVSSIQHFFHNRSVFVTGASGFIGTHPPSPLSPSTVSFNKNSSQFANVMWGSYGDPQTIRVKVTIIRIPGTNDYRISPKVYTVSDAGEAGFESKRPLIGLWSSEFGPLLKKVAATASGAGQF